MQFFEIVLLGIGLAMDATTTSICKGFSMKAIPLKNALTIAFYFGIFQALMPLIGYYMGNTFLTFLENVDHWIAFGVLVYIGAHMIRESKNTEKTDSKIDLKTMLVLSMVTSIDALACGITFSFFKINILGAALTIGIITFILSFAGVILGSAFGTRLKDKAEVLGGVILILMGIKMLF